MNKFYEQYLLNKNFAIPKSLELFEKLDGVKIPNEYIGICVCDEEIEIFEDLVKEFFKRNFRGLNQNTLHIEEDIYFDIEENIQNTNLTNEQYFEKIRKNLRQVNSYDIPISLTYDEFDSYIMENHLYNNVYFIGDIVLSIVNIGNISSMYAHELSHVFTQKNQKYIFSSMLDNEVLSIFIEKLMYGGENIEYKINELNRWIGIKGANLDCSDDVDISLIHTYYNSLLKANYLYYLYRNMNEYQKSKLFKNIKLIFEGQRKRVNFLRNEKMI